MLELPFFEEKLEQLKTATNTEGRRWLRGLMREPKKWTRAYDDGGWRYEFQTSNMAESLIVYSRVYVPCASMPLYHSPSIGWLHGLMRDTLKQWHYRGIIRHGHLNL